MHNEATIEDDAFIKFYDSGLCFTCNASKTNIK